MRFLDLRTQSRQPRRLAVTPWLAASMCLTMTGCFSSSTSGPARRWLDPLGLRAKKDLGEQPEFRKQVSKDPFPSASQVGLQAQPQK
jgi:hypothetical protein